MEYSHPISPCKSEKYDATFGTTITVCLKKIGGMMLWIMSGTFNPNPPRLFWGYFTEFIPYEMMYILEHYVFVEGCKVIYQWNIYRTNNKMKKRKT